MPTPDGISSEDWDVVHGLAVDIVNAPEAQRPALRRQLLAWFDELEIKYGPLPSILASRADYLEIEDPAREDLLIRANTAAESMGDQLNLAETAHSLAELFLERNDLTGANLWLERLRRCLDHYSDSDLVSEYERLREIYRRLAIRVVGSREG